MTKIKPTNIIIWVLVVLAIYQTSILWFANLSNKSIFENFYNTKNEHTPNYLHAMESLFINVDDGKFIKKYTSISTADYKLIFDNTISNALNSSKSSNTNYTENYDTDTLFSSKSIIYTYDFPIYVNDMLGTFGIKKISGLEHYDMVAILPCVDEYVEIIFLSRSNGDAYKIQFNQYNLSNEIMEIIEELENMSSKEYYYILEDIGYVNDNVASIRSNFLPISNGNHFDVNKITSINPLESAGGILLAESEKYMDIFFDNPLTKTSSFINDTYTYNDDNVVVKYYTNGVLEYSNYKKQLSQSQENTYKTAIDFLARDTHLKNEFYLQDYKIEDDKTTFYFNYKINNFSIILSQNMLDKTNMKSMIEIEIQNGIVSKYKKMIYDFYLLDNFSIVNLDFENFMNNYNIDNTIENIDLKYIFDGVGEEISLKLHAKTNDNIYVFDTN